MKGEGWGGGRGQFEQEKLPSKSRALLGLKFQRKKIQKF